MSYTKSLDKSTNKSTDKSTDESTSESSNESIVTENEKTNMIYILKNLNKKYQIKYIKMEMKNNKYLDENKNFILENEKLKYENRKSSIKIYKLYSAIIVLTTSLSYIGYLFLKLKKK